MKKRLIIVASLLLLSSSAFCVRIDGKFWDWVPFDASYGKEYECKKPPLQSDRSGLELEKARLSIGKKYIYVMVEGRSVTGEKRDKGEGFGRTSVRINFSSAQSPLNRVRVVADPANPGQIKISMPGMETKTFGGINDRYWARGRYSGRYAFEVKIPIYVSSKGLHVGSKSGPLVRLTDSSLHRKRLSDILVNTVDTQTHRLVSTATLPIRPGDL